MNRDNVQYLAGMVTSAVTMLAVIALVLTMNSCAPRNPALTPHGNALLVADNVVLRLGELGDTAIAASQANGVSHDAAVKVAKFVRSAVGVVKEAPEGWQAAVKALWQALRDNLDSAVKTRLGVIWTTVDGLLGGA